MPLKINNTIDVLNPINTYNRKQLEVITFSFVDGVSPIQDVNLKILKMPVSINNPTYNKKWDNTTANSIDINTTTTTFLHLVLEGTYKIEVTETYVSGVVRKRMVIIEAISLNNTIGIPFPGESLEMDGQDGWARKVEKSIQALSQASGAYSIVGKDFTLEHQKGDLVVTSSIEDKDPSGFLYVFKAPSEVIPPDSVRQMGIVIDKWESGSSEVFDPVIIYKVAISGAFYVGSDFLYFTGSVYYDETTKELTDDSAYTYVGQYIDNVLIIERPVIMESVHNDLLGRDEDDAHPGSAISLNETLFSIFLNGKNIDDVQKLANEIDEAVGRVDGIASLDGTGRLPLEQLPISAMEYKGTWNASTNTPILSNSGSHTNGDVWLCTTAGTTDFGAGDISFLEGDWVVYNGSIWERSVNSENRYSNPNPSINEVGGILPGSTFSLETVQEMFNWMLYEEYPVLIEPTYTLIWTINESPVSGNESLQEVGEDIDIKFNPVFNRGLIDSSAWGDGSEDRTGNVEKHESFDNSYLLSIEDYVGDYDSITVNALNHTVIEGSVQQAFRITFYAGNQPKSKFDRDYDNPHPGGTMDTQTVTIIGVYPVYATTSDITTMTKQNLQKHDEDVIVDLVAESGSDKQTIDIPQIDDWDDESSTIYQWNTISGQWDDIGKSDFSITADVSDPYGYGVNYRRYEYNDSLMGARRLKFVFS